MELCRSHWAYWLPDDKVVQEVLLGETGVNKRLNRGQIVVDLSTITYSAATGINEVMEARGVSFLDAPISGMEARAIEGTLTVTGRKQPSRSTRSIAPNTGCFRVALNRSPMTAVIRSMPVDEDSKNRKTGAETTPANRWDENWSMSRASRSTRRGWI